jgi:hypothetical protein
MLFMDRIDFQYHASVLIIKHQINHHYFLKEMIELLMQDFIRTFFEVISYESLIIPPNFINLQ